MSASILTINGGSSSIKFAVFTCATPPTRAFGGQIDRIGSPEARLTVKNHDDAAPEALPVAAPTFHDAAKAIHAYLRERLGTNVLAGIGHRIVHGGVRLFDHQLLTPEVMAQLREARELDLAHLPREIDLIDSFAEAFPALPQVACFDTAFCHDLPRVAQILAIPRRYFNAGIRRLGFHGLSYTYLMSRLPAPAANGRVILAHLGSGASMAAVQGGKPIDTTMAFTPNAGLVMGTRPGDIDPGLLVYLMRLENISPQDMDKFISKQCGLLGVSETTFDMRDLIERSSADQRAADAVALFCYQARKFIGSYFAALGGLDTLVFSGGIGEHSPQVRTQICEGLDCLGISIDLQRNSTNQDVISADSSRVVVRVIPTDEEVVIAQAVMPFIRDGNK